MAAGVIQKFLKIIGGRNKEDFHIITWKEAIRIGLRLALNRDT